MNKEETLVFIKLYRKKERFKITLNKLLYSIRCEFYQNAKMQNRFVKTIIYFANYKVTYQLVKIMKIDGKILDKRISSSILIHRRE